MNTINIDNIITLVQAIGLPNTIFTIIILSYHFHIFIQYNARLKDRQSEINKLAKENREYREIFLTLLDKRFNFNKESY